MIAQILEGTEENFSTLVLENSHQGLVLVDFWSPQAGPSLRQREILKSLSIEMAGRFLLVTVDTDRQSALVREYGIRAIPSFNLFRNGRVVEKVRGMQPEADYRTIIERHLLPLGDKVRLSAAKAWNAGDQDKAIQVLAEGAIADPENLSISAMLSKLLIRLARYEDARKVLVSLPREAQQQTEIATLLAHLDFILTAQAVDDESGLRRRLAADPTDLEAQFQTAAVRLMNDDYAACLEALMSILQQDRTWQSDRARCGLLAVSDILGTDHELVRKHRNELFRLIH